jgi:hypothetical protein
MCTAVEKFKNLSILSVENQTIVQIILLMWRTYPQKMWKTCIFEENNHFSQTYPQ